jgi:hypothetical protein
LCRPDHSSDAAPCDVGSATVRPICDVCGTPCKVSILQLLRERTSHASRSVLLAQSR